MSHKDSKLHELVVVCTGLNQTDEFGLQISQFLTPGIAIGLNGTLGSGKTRLVQAIATGLGIPTDQVVSPTFTICVPHSGRLKILHVDAYRINHQEEIDELGLDEDVENGAVLLVEWAERVKASLPPLDIQIEATPIDKSTRQFRITGVTTAGELIVESLSAWHSAR